MVNHRPGVRSRVVVASGGLAACLALSLAACDPVSLSDRVSRAPDPFDSIRNLDLTPRFPLIVEAVAKLPASSCVIDGEAVACGEDGIACFELLLERWDIEGGVFMYAFDLIELNGDDFRRHPLVVRKSALARRDFSPYCAED